MKENIEKNYIKLNQIPCEDNLEARIITSIRNEQIKLVKIKLGIFGLSFLTLGGFFISLFAKILADFQNSVFYEYASVLISDSTFAMTHWKPTLLLLLESAPMLDLFLVFSMLGILLYLLSKTTKEVSIYFKPKLIYK